MNSFRTVAAMLLIVVLNWNAMADWATCKMCDSSTGTCKQALEGEWGGSECWTEIYVYEFGGYCSEYFPPPDGCSCSPDHAIVCQRSRCYLAGGYCMTYIPSGEFTSPNQRQEYLARREMDAAQFATALRERLSPKAFTDLAQEIDASTCELADLDRVEATRKAYRTLLALQPGVQMGPDDPQGAE